MTEPSKEALEAGKKALLDDYISNPNIPGGPILTNPHTANTGSGRVLHAALPIERERWEKETRERSEGVKARDAAYDAACNASPIGDLPLSPDEIKEISDAATKAALDAIFDKGEGEIDADAAEGEGRR
jgi:hypothetical protein